MSTVPPAAAEPATAAQEPAATPARGSLPRLLDEATLGTQQALVAGAAVLPCALVLALLHLVQPQALAGWAQASPLGLAGLALLLGAGAAAAASATWARRQGQQLRRLTECARRLHADDDDDALSLPRLPSGLELREASHSLRRLHLYQREQRQALLARNAALGQQLHRRSHELSTLQDLSLGLAAGQDVFELGEEALKALEQTLEYSSASLWARDESRHQAPVVLVGWRLGDGEPEPARSDTLRGRPLSRANLQRYQQIERTQAPIVENDVRQGLLPWLWERVTDDSPTSALYHNSRAWTGLPLSYRDQVLGVMRVDHHSPGYFTPERNRLLAAVCGQTALALHHAELLRRQRELAVSNERNRIARELHDAVSQTLFAANVIAGTLVKLASRSGGAEAGTLRSQAHTLERLNRGALAEMRLLMFELQPDALAMASLAELIKPAIEALQCRGDIQVQAALADHDNLAPAVRMQVYRIAQEGLSNIGRHSSATEASVRWQPDAPEGALLVMTDNGSGFDANLARPGHFGLGNMRSRADEIGATLRVRSSPGAGTEIELLLPANQAPATEP